MKHPTLKITLEFDFPPGTMAELEEDDGRMGRDFLAAIAQIGFWTTNPELLRDVRALSSEPDSPVQPCVQRATMELVETDPDA